MDFPLGVAGVLSMLGPAGSAPSPPINLAADFGGGGLSCALGILAALVSRGLTGAGQVAARSLLYVMLLPASQNFVLVFSVDIKENKFGDLVTSNNENSFATVSLRSARRWQSSLLLSVMSGCYN
jgi:crotonobetainyl-CoA:carnitine CoA-transferase CaiB-like acyl-CoA transferase